MTFILTQFSSVCARFNNNSCNGSLSRWNCSTIYKKLIAENPNPKLQTFFVSLNSSLLSNGATVLKNFFDVSANVGTGNLTK
jgi:hypothetical protein